MALESWLVHSTASFLPIKLISLGPEEQCWAHQVKFSVLCIIPPVWHPRQRWEGMVKYGILSIPKPPGSHDSWKAPLPPRHPVVLLGLCRFLIDQVGVLRPMRAESWPHHAEPLVKTSWHHDESNACCNLRLILADAAGNNIDGQRVLCSQTSGFLIFKSFKDCHVVHNVPFCQANI